MSNSAADEIAHQLFDTPEGRQNPYPLYHQLRDLAPVHKSYLGNWLVTEYEDCAALLRDPRFGKNYPAQVETTVGKDWREHVSLTSFERSMLNLDGPDHTRLRRLVVKSFNRKTVDAMRPRIAGFVREMLEPFAEAGGGDLLAEVAFPLPVRVIGELLGVPEQDRHQFRKLVSDLVAAFEMQPTDEQIVAADEAQLTIRRYFDGLIDEKRRNPCEDLMSHLIQADEDGDRLNNDELAQLGLLLFAAGFETTTNLLGNGMVGLINQPDQLARLRSEPELLEGLPDELLRFDGTAQMAARYTNAPAEMSGVTIPAGETVIAMLGAGNHDPARYDDPDQIDVGREKIRPLSFGGGIHFCLGAALARTEIEVTVGEIIGRFGHIEFAAEPVFRDRLTLRGLEKLELSCRTADGARPTGAARARTPRVEAKRTPAPRAPADANADILRLRPTPGSDADFAWRNALRARVETAAETADAPWVRSGTELAQTMVLLARAELFRGCTPEEIQELATTAYPVSFEPGDTLCEEGAEPLDCYVIAEGEANVTIAGREVSEVGENDVVGERGPLEDRVRTATVTAETHMVTYAISRQRLLALVEKSPAAADGMFAYMRRRYSD